MTRAPTHDHAPTLARRILSETTRFAALQAIAAMLAWSANIVLARLLEREDYGVYGIGTLCIGMGSLLGDGGLAAALLRRKRPVRPFEFRVALTSTLAVSSVLAALLFFCAPWIGAANHFAPSQVRVLQAMAPLYLVSAFRAVPYIRLERDLQFTTIARIELVASITRHVVAIGMAAAHAGVWSLVVSGMVSTSLQLWGAYRASPGWVGLGWSWRVFRPLIEFGGKIQAQNIAGFLKDNVSRGLLGPALGPAAVGLFDFGLAYIQVPVAAVNALARVQLPVYARLNADDPTLYGALRGAMRTALVLGIPLLCVLALGAQWIVPTIYRPKWAAADPVIWGLFANMVFGLLASPLFTLFQGQGRPGLSFVVFLGWTSATWALAIAAVHYFPGSLGMVAAAYSVVTVVVVTGMVRWAEVHLKQQLFGSLARPVVAGAVALALGLLQRNHAPGWLRHPLAAAGSCLLSYLLLLFLLDRQLLLAEMRTVFSSLSHGKAPSPATEPQPATTAQPTG